jgi:hypothetical protein
LVEDGEIINSTDDGFVQP